MNINVLAKILITIAIIGAVNWGLIGFFNFNLVDAIFGGGSAEETSAVSRVVYALVGLAEFSHVEVVFQFHLLDEAEVVTGLRHPRGRTDWPKVGIFAQRGRNRPNRLGVSVAELIAVDDTTLTVRGLDAIDGTPVLDLKPVLSGFAPRGAVREPAWARALMATYW